MGRYSVGLAATAIAFEAGIAGVAWLLGRILGEPAFAQVTPSWPGTAAGLVGTVPLVIWLLVAIRTPSGPFRSITRDIDEIVVPIFVGWPVLALALVSLLAGVAEEALFRGVLLGAVARWTNTSVAVLVTSVAFGLAHLVSPHYAIMAGLIGLYLGGITVVAHDTFPAMIAHATYDFVALVYLVRVRAPGITADRTAEEPEPPPHGAGPSE